MDLKHYLKEWWSDGSLRMEPEVEDPLSFWKSIFSFVKPCKSLPFESYDFYHDCIIRHLDKNHLAIDGEDKWTYGQVHALVQNQLLYWKSFDLEPGKKVVLALPQGIDFIASLMTALYLGLTISFFPLDDPYLGPKKLKQLLEKLSPDALVTLPSHRYLWKEVIEWDLSQNSQTTPKAHAPEAPHVYAAGERVFTFLDADAAFLCPLRDGFLTLSLKEETLWARPLASPLHDEPFATLAALLSGATLFHVPDAALLSDPEYLKNTGIEVLGVSSRLLELWAKTQGCPKSKLRFWYKTPLFSPLAACERFAEINELKKIPQSDLLIEPKKGGVILASKPKPYTGQSFLLPSLGVPWKVLELNGSGEESFEGVGFFDLHPSLVLGQIQESWTISWTTSPVQKGAFYPLYEIEQCVNQLDFILESMVVGTKDPKDIAGSRMTLICFVTPEKRFTETAEWENRIHQNITEEVGKAFFPDRILFYHCYPKQAEGKLSRNWVLGQHQGGFLSRKEKSPVYQKLNLFRHAIYQNLANL